MPDTQQCCRPESGLVGSPRLEDGHSATGGVGRAVRWHIGRMDRETYESLTPMERNCLRLARHDRKAEQIAHMLGIKASTVNTHVFSARRKLGGLPRLTAADELRRFEADRDNDFGHGAVPASGALVANAPSSAPAPDQHPISRHALPMVDAGPIGPERGHPAEVREARSVFVFDDAEEAVSGGQDGRPDEPLRRVALILAIALLVCLVLIAAPAIYDSAAQRLANSIELPHTS